jgi:N-methylhydantoinase B
VSVLRQHGHRPPNGRISPTSFKNTPVEAAELEYPVRIERYELIGDTGGKRRGTLGLRRDIRVLI